MTSPYYRVDYYQLNAGLDCKGDCAIVLLVRINPTVDLFKGTIKKAVIIDVGNAEKIARLLEYTIDKLQTQYLGYGSGQTLKFDAVSISHWDDVRPQTAPLI